MKYLILFFVFATSLQLTAQPVYDAKRDFVWVFGYDYGASDSVDNIWMDFRGDSMVLSYRPSLNGMEMFYTNNSICDADGNLLMFTNGCNIKDSSYQTINGLVNMNYNPLYTSDCYSTDPDKGSVVNNGMFILPTSQYNFSLIHQLITLNSNNWSYAKRVLWTQVTQDSVTNELHANFNNRVIYEGQLTLGNAAATRHANGRDWWVVMSGNHHELPPPDKYFCNEYYKFLVQPDTVLGPYMQEFGPFVKWNEGNGGQSAFTPDGSKFIRYNALSDVKIFDFDRCTGEFTDSLQIMITDYCDTMGLAGVAVSPNNRYLYLASSHLLYQFDLWADSIALTKDTIAVLDFMYDLTFYKLESGPDGKIYILGGGGHQAFGVIEYPNLPGDSCMPVQHKFVLENAGIVGGLPHHPNFRLGPLVGSACDTLSTPTAQLLPSGWRLYPNPVSDELVLGLPDGYAVADLRVWCVNALGQHLPLSARYDHKDLLLNVQELPNGTYFLQVEEPNGHRLSRQFVVLH
jgi:Secretion system C-terminal sorting domain